MKNKPEPKVTAVEELKALLESSRKEMRDSSENLSNRVYAARDSINKLEERMLKLVGHMNDLNKAMAETLDNYMRCNGLVQMFPGKKKGGAEAVDMIANLLVAKRAHQPPHA